MPLSSRMLARLMPQRRDALKARAQLRAIVTHRPAVVAQVVLDSGVMWPGGPKLTAPLLASLHRDIRRHERAVAVYARLP